MEDKKVIILGSSRKNGNTTRIADEISKETGIDIINLSDYNISYYDYESKNREDDFFPLIKDIIEKYDTLIFATPIYWYNMSGIMKVFFDRFSDLIRIEKETGRKLRGKKIGVISNSHDNEIEESFYIPFKKSADYLGMEYLGHAHFNANILNETTKIELTFT
ncbi:flavodoxin family protein [Flavobacterium tructae]|uniref:flavodoxin family protein n=1 Tax=Flavobacterium tructae TaxID=1114873 RepID=UPI0035A92503